MRHPFRPAVARLDITPPEVFFNRRSFLSTLALGLVGAPAAFCGSGPGAERVAAGVQEQADPLAQLLAVPLDRPDVFPAKANAGFGVPSAIARKALMPRQVAASHNNFYEFLPGTGGPVWREVDAFEVDPWTIEIGGECAKPVTLDLDDIFAFPHEERVYHFRCVERWAMNVPWTGFPLKTLLDRVEPTGAARYVRFVTARRPDQMPGIRDAAHYPWPYHEGLRMDEAMHELTMVVTGVYGEPLLKQHGAPVRIIVPWKYGYKSPKSIVKIELVRDEPRTFWQIQPHEYGFLSNINPNIPHPRWSQSVSYWLDTKEPFDTPIFNGYGDRVASLYPDEPTTPQTPLRPGQTAR